MTEELVKYDAAPMVPVSDSTSMLGLIGQMAANPAVDIDKLERLMKIQVEMQERENETAFNAVMALTQGEIGVIAKNRHNDHTESDYADIGAIVEVITPIYTKQGLNVSFDAGPIADGCIPLACYVSAYGHTKTYHYDSPVTDKGIQGSVMMIPAHARKSAISYGRNTLLAMIFNIGTKDDDGNATAQVERITDEQVADLEALIEEVGADKSLFLKWLKTDDLANIQASAYAYCVSQLENKRK